MKPLHLFTISSVTLLTACGGGGGGTGTTAVPYPDVTTTQQARAFDDMSLEYVAKALVYAALPAETAETLSGEYTYVGVGMMEQTEDTIACTITSSCTYAGNADVVVNFDTSRYAGKIYNVRNNTAIEWDGELVIKGSVSDDGSLTANLSGAITNPNLNATRAVSSSDLEGQLLDTGSDGGAISVGGTATIADKQHTVGLVAGAN